jgi:hypothetical protein
MQQIWCMYNYGRVDSNRLGWGIRKSLSSAAKDLVLFVGADDEVMWGVGDADRALGPDVCRVNGRPTAKS